MTRDREGLPALRWQSGDLPWAMTYADAAEVLSVSTRTVQRLVADGRLRVADLGLGDGGGLRGRRVTGESLREFWATATATAQESSRC